MARATHIEFMATYVYETIPSSETEEPIRFEVKQSMNDDPLTHHPENGLPVKRIITGGYGFNVSGSAISAPMPAAGSSCCQSGGCGCSDN